MQVVGDLAQFMVQNELTEKELVDRAQTLDFPSRCSSHPDSSTATIVLLFYASLDNRIVGRTTHGSCAGGSMQRQNDAPRLHDRAILSISVGGRTW